MSPQQTPAHSDTVPTAAELVELLLREPDIELLELGVALDLPVRFLLSQAPWSDPGWLLNCLLQAACPVDLPQLALALESDSLKGWNLAGAVRGLMADLPGGQLTRAHQATRTCLVQLLRPLADSSYELGIAMDLRPEQVVDLQRAARAQGSREEEARQFVRQACDRAPERTREDWLKLIAQSGAGGLILERIATHWQVPLRGCSSGYQYLMQQHDMDSLSQLVLEQHRQDPAAAVPLSRAWPLVQEYAGRSTFALALGDATPPDLRALCDCRKAGLLSLLHAAAAEGIEGMDWSSLVVLAHLGLAEPALAAQINDPAPAASPARCPAAGPVSRRLQPCDLVLLAHWTPTEKEGLEVAALLGVGQDYERLQFQFHHLSPEERGLEIWRHLYQRIPLLETGHLVELFGQFGKWILVERLTGNKDTTLSPLVPLYVCSARAERFVGLAEQLRQHPHWVPAFVAAQGLDADARHGGPPGTDPILTLLNTLALDARLLQRFEAFRRRAVQAELADPRPVALDRNPGETTREGQPYAFLCPITGEYMDDPVPLPAAAGVIRYFSQISLLNALSYRPMHPITLQHLDLHAVPSVDQAYLARIRSWRARHPELEDS